MILAITKENKSQMNNTIEYLDICVPSNTYEAELKLREKILRTPLGLKLTDDDIAYDHQQRHIGAFCDNQLIGCVLVSQVQDKPLTFKIRQMAVLDIFQGKGVGRDLMLKAEQGIQSKGGQRVILEARKSALRFYLSLNYQVISDDFIHKTLPHILMEKHLSSFKHEGQVAQGK